MVSKTKNHLFKDPHSYVEILGNLPIRVKFPVSNKFPTSCAAFANLAKVSAADDRSFAKGLDNYSASLEKLLQLLDAFIREKSHNNETAGQQYHYSFSDNCEFTILLLWQLRHVMAHSGSVIDETCKRSYEKIYRKRNVGTRPVIGLPETLEPGQELVIQQEDFKKVRNCAFGFIKKQVPAEDFQVFIQRASFTEFEITGGVMGIRVDQGVIYFNVRTAAKNGVKINLKTGKLDRPDGTTFSFDDNRIHLPTGESFPAKIIPNEDDSDKINPDIFDIK
jgi:hypothetical protein